MNKEERREYYKQYRIKNADKYKQYRKDNADIIRQQRKQYYTLNTEKFKTYYNNSIEKRKLLRIKNYEKRKEYKAKYNNRQYNSSVEFRLTGRLRGRLGKAIKRQQKSGSAVRDLGCSVAEFKDYIASKFKDGMTWDNWGKNGWHLDHIMPLACFDLTDRRQFLMACHYTNYQPLWAVDNLKKNDFSFFTFN